MGDDDFLGGDAAKMYEGFQPTDSSMSTFPSTEQYLGYDTNRDLYVDQEPTIFWPLVRTSVTTLLRISIVHPQLDFQRPRSKFVSNWIFFKLIVHRKQFHEGLN